MTITEPLPRERLLRRRHDLDALRVGAFGLLILYHAGMFYVTWDWHVKSPHAGPTLEVLMLVVNPWRLALLFFISGVAARFAVDQRPVAAFLKRRIRRLGLPLLFGVLVVVPPQSYFELREAGVVEPGFLGFYLEYLSPTQTFEIITPTWNHLWYVAYLLAYSLILTLVHPLIGSRADPIDQGTRRLFGRGPWVLVVPVLPFLIYRFALDPHFPTTHALVDDWANHAHRFTIFLLGYLVAKDPSFWDALDRCREWSFRLAIGWALALSTLRVVPGVEAWIVEHPLLITGLRVLDGFYAWWCIAALLGWAQRRLNHSGPWLSYLSEGTFPFYIVHQTIIVTVGSTLAAWGVSLPFEAAGILAATAVGCWLVYELARRVRLLSPLLGL